MKTRILILAAALLSLTLNAKQANFSYLITESDTIYCDQIHMGFTKGHL